VQARFTITNTGKVGGKGLAQLYVAGNGWEAPKRLGGFSKVDLAPGESRTIDMTVDPRLLATFDSTTRGWKIAGGDYQLLLAHSATDIAARATVRLAGATLDKRGR
jgi:beta-glucosidase